jgi:hypothetical protein
MNGVVINDTPKMCIPNPDDSTHSIEVTDNYAISAFDMMCLPT